MFSKNLAQLQADRGESNYRLAKSIGVHQTTIKNWKDGTTPHPKHIRLVAEHYGCTEAELLSEKADNDCALAPGGGDNG